MAKRTIREPISIGDRFGRWVVKDTAAPKMYGAHAHHRWLCQCECGTERPVTQISLHSGASVSCGCFNRERSIARHTTHGHVNGGKATPEYSVWQAMNARCRNPSNPRYADYGGRGIQICERWQTFEAFFADMGPKPTPAHQLDRENNDKGYGPDNCRWATPAEQMVNRRNTRFVDVNGEMIPLATLAKQAGLPANTLRFRILKGWDLARALSEPISNTGPKRKRAP